VVISPKTKVSGEAKEAVNVLATNLKRGKYSCKSRVGSFFAHHQGITDTLFFLYDFSNLIREKDKT